MRSARKTAARVVAAGVLALAAGACERRAAQSGADTAAGAAHIAPPPPAALTAALSAGEQAAIARIPAGAGHDIVVANCLICHGPSLIEQQHKDTTGWNKTVTQMVAWGAPLPPAEQPILVAYLAQHYGGRAAGPPARPAP